jgi:AcrR family transcriptional regulator
MPTQAERRGATIGALVQAAQHLFETRGFANTTVDDIVKRAGVAKGAFYHHYKSKESIFASVVDLMQASIARKVTQVASNEASSVGMLRRGLRAYMEECSRPPIRRVLLLDGPSVLGWLRWREIDDKYFGQMTRRAVSAALGPEARTTHAQAVAALISGAFAEAAMLTAASADCPFTPLELSSAMDVLLKGLDSDPIGAMPKRSRLRA